MPKFRNWSRDLNHAPLGVKFSYSDKGPTKFGVRSFIHSKVMDVVPNFKFRSRDPDHAHFRGQFVVRWLERAIVNVCTKYEVSIFGHSKDIKVPKFRNWSRDVSHAPSGVKFSYFDKGLQAVY